MKPDPDSNAFNQTELPLEIFWLEQFRLAVQTAQLACNHCELLSRFALMGSRELMPQRMRHDDE